MTDPDQMKAGADAAFRGGNIQSAIDLYRDALTAKPDWAAVHNNLAMAYRQMEDAESSEKHFRLALENEPELVGALSNLGGLLVEQKRIEEAAVFLRRALALEPNNAGVLCNLGLLSFQRHDDLKAIEFLQRSVSLNNNFAPAFFTLGNLHLRQPDYAAAADQFARVLELSPSHKHAAVNRAKALSSLGLVDESYATLRQVMEVDPTFTAAHSNLILKQHYDPRLSPSALYAEARRWSETHEAQSASAPKPVAIDPERVLRVGYLSPHLTRHPVGYFVEPVLKHHDGEQVTAICYADDLQQDGQSERLRAHAIDWQDVSAMDHNELAERIRADGIDILIDLDGHSGPNRLPVFARRAAPIQVTWAGYVGTTGLDAMDYLVTDTRQTVDADLQYMTEQPVYMPGNYVSLAPIESAPEVGPCPSEKQGVITFGCFNSLNKINESVVQLWSQILATVPDSRLKLITFDLGDRAVRLRIARMFVACGVEVDRLDLLGRMPRAELLAAYSTVDIALDPFPYSGGLTTLESLWMGVPVITKRDGDRFASRHSVTHLTAVGLTECIAENAEDYLARAVALADDSERRATLRATLRETMRSSPACDGASFTRALERAFRIMWQRYCEGEQPTAISEADLKP